ncbi:tyrosine-type recombinase/integrase [Streptomyces sp. NPDC088246]|uniref:tyrosine-type recombinase/integrase n=1 Tax=Streptomyces sp. NPDC088246 TaxID=3365842 RepID=UPI0037F51B9B
METGRIFTRENGELLHPANVTRRFIELCEEIALPPIRLHDLRHGAATLAHAAGVGLKDIQEMLGHSSITITSDTHTSLLPEADLAIAEVALFTRTGSSCAPVWEAANARVRIEMFTGSDSTDVERLPSGALHHGGRRLFKVTLRSLCR